jgi:hypothetical protein
MSYSFAVELPVYTSSPEGRADDLAGVYAESLAAAGKAFADVMQAKGGHEPSIKVSVIRADERLVSGVVSLSPTYKVVLYASGHVILPEPAAEGGAGETGAGGGTTTG